MRKAAVIFGFLLIVPVFFVGAGKNYTSEKIVFLPQEFYVGDLVEMRIVVNPSPGVKMRKPERFPDSYWLRIENADVFELDGKYELRVFLRSYAPGIRTLPPVQFGDVLLRDIRIQTKSVLDENPAGLSPTAGQMLLPGTNYYIAMLTGIVFILPIILIIFWGRFKSAARDYLIRRIQKRPYKRLVKVLKELEDSLNDKKGKVFYTELIDAVRVYFTERGSIDYTAATAREGVKGITADFSELENYGDLISLFKFADEVKFGDRRVMIRKREEHLALIEAASGEIEKLMTTGGGKDVDI
ncbi:MAG: hypothetical protein JEZ04_14555 [Spirochaetales bacterium]|nr:hypothetical protein [Spirochaetales bacterium]